MTLEQLLQEEPRARERKHKMRAIATVLQNRHYPLKEIPQDKLMNYLAEAVTLDRQWRKLLEDNPELRGSDYADKKRLEQKAQVKLGYEPRHYQDVKTLNLL